MTRVGSVVEDVPVWLPQHHRSTYVGGLVEPVGGPDLRRHVELEGIEPSTSFSPGAGDRRCRVPDNSYRLERELLCRKLSNRLEGETVDDTSREDMWKGLQKGLHSDDRLSLVGAHLSPISAQLENYLKDLEQAREHLDEDLRLVGQGREFDSPHVSWPIRQSIDNAIGNVRVALQLVKQAQEAIVSVFPT